MAVSQSRTFMYGSTGALCCNGTVIDRACYKSSGNIVTDTREHGGAPFWMLKLLRLAPPRMRFFTACRTSSVLSQTAWQMLSLSRLMLWGLPSIYLPICRPRDNR